MDERIDELLVAFKEIYDVPENMYSFENKEFVGAKLIELDDISFKRIVGLEKCTEEEIQKLKEKLSKDGNFWVKKSDWK